jgi:hypothetical protein
MIIGGGASTGVLLASFFNETVPAKELTAPFAVLLINSNTFFRERVREARRVNKHRKTGNFFGFFNSVRGRSTLRQSDRRRRERESMDVLVGAFTLPVCAYFLGSQRDSHGMSDAVAAGCVACIFGMFWGVLCAGLLISRLTSIVIDKWRRTKSCWREHAEMSAEAQQPTCASRVGEPRRRSGRLRAAAAVASAEAANFARDGPDDCDHTICVLCEENVKCVMVNDCGHLCMCEACTRRVLDSGARCPICRGAITAGGTRRVFW